MPALFGTPFRPFFLFGLLYGLLAMALWVATLLLPEGWPLVPMLVNTPLMPVFWHGHALVFGFCGAIGVGFLLTAAGNWMGKPLLTPGQTAVLLLLWLLGRIAMLSISLLPPWWACVADGLFPLAALLLLLWRVGESSNPWHRAVLVAFALFAILHILSLPTALELIPTPWASTGPKLGMAALVLIAATLGGRIIPLFTVNWLKSSGTDSQADYTPLPWLENSTLLATLLVVIGMILVGMENRWMGLLYLLTAALHLLRMARWQGHRTLSAPIVWVMHVGYLTIPMGLFFLAMPFKLDVVRMITAFHIWTIGVGGLFLIGIVTRVALGHTGRPIQPHPWTVLAYGLLMLALLVRSILPMLWQELLGPSYWLSAAIWCAAMLLILLRYTPILLSRRPDGKAG
ncbi:NnrS family protein [Magnetococcus marinus MC-1]|uniref:NnrS family protein n=1 Tax=Magnetococcus marinus (strain ATCC BAA-1437 / JCM 17883 / MC-1) TaxID=156889 RepID=A0LA29_MAGMM|nr:NnrS family protein [Magnetococcus marinus]ABK44822.1 NnrS family protein [Magnetococcus marinus MC-1]